MDDFYLGHTLKKIKEMREATNIKIKYSLLGEYHIILWVFGKLLSDALRYYCEDEIKNAGKNKFPELYAEVEDYLL